MIVICHQNILVIYGVLPYRGIQRITYGEMMIIHMKLENDHVQNDGMFHLRMNGKLFIILGLIVVINQLVNFLERILLKI